MPRHRILYDVERWRRNRFFLLFAAAVFLALSVLQSGGQAKSGTGTVYSVASAAFIGFALAFWMRQKFTYVTVEPGRVVVRVMLSTVHVPASDIRRVKTGRLVSVFGEPSRRRFLPRPATRWLQREAAMVRLTGHSESLNRLHKLLGSRCVVGHDLIFPVAQTTDLVREISAQLITGTSATMSRSSTRKGRRR